MPTEAVKSEITGKVWKIEIKPGDKLEEDDIIMLIESMKMEIPVMAPIAGILKEINVAEGDDVTDGQQVAVIEY